MTDICVAREGEHVKVTPGPELTAREALLIRSALKLKADGAREIVFDMSGAKTLDYAGLCLLIAAHNSMRATGGTVRLVGLSNDIFKLLQGMRLADRLNAAPASGGGADD